jgi:hypothetical protein
MEIWHLSGYVCLLPEVVMGYNPFNRIPHPGDKFNFTLVTHKKILNWKKMSVYAFNIREIVFGDTKACFYRNPVSFI